MFSKYDLLVDFFVVTNQANYQDYSGIYNWGRHCISWSYTRTPRLLYLRTARISLFISQKLFNIAVLYMIFQFAGDFFSDSTHHVGFPLSPFTDLLCINGYHPTLYTVEPELELVLQNMIFSFSSWQIKRTVKTTRGFITEVGITRTPRFLVTLKRHLVIYLAETFVKVWLCLIRPCCLWSFSSQGTFSSIVPIM